MRVASLSCRLALRSHVVSASPHLAEPCAGESAAPGVSGAGADAGELIQTPHAAWHAPPQLP